MPTLSNQNLAVFDIIKENMEKQMNFIDDIDINVDLFEELLGDIPYCSVKTSNFDHFCEI